MLTRTGFTKLLTKIWETGGLTPDMEEDIQKLKDDYDEREGELRKYGEVYDGEDKDEYEYRGRDISGGDWENKYNDMRQRYINRFMSGKPENPGEDSGSDFEEIAADEAEDVKEDNSNSDKSFDELLYESEEE